MNNRFDGLGGIVAKEFRLCEWVLSPRSTEKEWRKSPRPSSFADLEISLPQRMAANRAATAEFIGPAGRRLWAVRVIPQCSSSSAQIVISEVRRRLWRSLSPRRSCLLGQRDLDEPNAPGRQGVSAAFPLVYARPRGCKRFLLLAQSSTVEFLRVFGLFVQPSCCGPSWFVRRSGPNRTNAVHFR